jgi:ubiquinone/menaquinone biosynthesis C-methylase UbiE
MGLFNYIGSQFRKPEGVGGNITTFIMNVINRRQYRVTDENLALNDGEKILDVGFGNGAIVKKLLKKHKCEFYGIDISEDMVKIASKRNPSAKFSKGDVAKIDYPNDFFDKIYTINTVYFWSDLSVGLSEIFRVLKSGGMFVNTIKSKEMLNKLPVTRNGFEKYTTDELKKASELCGFDVEIKSFSKGREYSIICKKG